jgi:hypothetical protein
VRYRLILIGMAELNLLFSMQASNMATNRTLPETTIGSGMTYNKRKIFHEFPVEEIHLHWLSQIPLQEFFFWRSSLDALFVLRM